MGGKAPTQPYPCSSDCNPGSAWEDLISSGKEAKPLESALRQYSPSAIRQNSPGCHRPFPGMQVTLRRRHKKGVRLARTPIPLSSDDPCSEIQPQGHLRLPRAADGVRHNAQARRAGIETAVGLRSRRRAACRQRSCPCVRKWVVVLVL